MKNHITSRYPRVPPSPWGCSFFVETSLPWEMRPLFVVAPFMLQFPHPYLRTYIFGDIWYANEMWRLVPFAAALIYRAIKKSTCITIRPLELKRCLFIGNLLRNKWNAELVEWFFLRSEGVHPHKKWNEEAYKKGLDTRVYFSGLVQKKIRETDFTYLRAARRSGRRCDC